MYRRIFTCIFILAMAAQTGYPQGIVESLKNLFSIKISDDIFSSLNKNIIGKLGGKNIKFIVPNTVEMDDVELLDGSGARMLYGKHVKLTISLLSLLTNNIRISDATIESPFFRYTIKKNVHNIISAFNSPPHITPSKKTASKTRVTIENVRIKNGRYEMYHDAGVQIFAQDINARGKFWVQSGPFEIAISQIDIKKGGILLDKIDLPIADLVAKDLFISNEKVTTKNIFVLSNQTKIHGEGTVFIKEDRYDVIADVDAPRDSYPIGLPPLEFIVPAFKAHVNMRGALAKPEFLASINHLDTEIKKIGIHKGYGNVKISPRHIEIISSNIHLKDNGEVFVSGSIDLASSKYDLGVDAKNVVIEKLLKSLGEKFPIHGNLFATGRLQGNYSTAPNISIKSKGTLHNASIDKVKFPADINFILDGDMLGQKQLVLSQAKLTDKSGLKISSSGEINLDDKSANIAFDLFCPEAARYYPLFYPHDSLRGLNASGYFRLVNQKIILHSNVHIATLDIANFKAKDLSAKLEHGANDQLAVKEIYGETYKGSVVGELAIANFLKENNLSGTVVIEGAHIEELTQKISPVKLQGIASASANFSGSLLHPTASFLLELSDLTVDKAQIKNTQIDGRLVDKKIQITRLIALLTAGSLISKNIVIDLADKKIKGDMAINSMDLSSLLSGYKARVQGALDGIMQIDGTFLSPNINAPLFARDLKVFGINLGQGPMTLSLAKEKLLGPGHPSDLVFSISTNLTNEDSHAEGRFSFALNEKTINSEVNIQGIEINTSEIGLKQNFGLIGVVEGKASFDGPLLKPAVTANMTMTNFGFFNPLSSMDITRVQRMPGPLSLMVASKKGMIDANLCASFLSRARENGCGEEPSLFLSFFGPFAWDEFSLDMAGAIDYSNLENIILFLRNELVTLDGKGKFHGKLIKKKGQDISYNAKLDLIRLKATLPNVPEVKLKEPISLRILDSEIIFEKNAVLEFSPGQLTMGGFYSPKRINMNFEGAIPLMLVRLFSPLVQRAEGLARGKIALQGSKNGLIIDGAITPDPGATFSLTKWLETIEFKEGKIAFHKTSNDSFSTVFNNIKLAVGDGRMFVNGRLNRQSRSETENPLTFNLSIQGSNIVIRDRLDFVETDFKIETSQKMQGKSFARGEIIITDGSAHRQFDLRNFVAQAQGGLKPGAFKFLDEIALQIALDIAIRQFKATARMLNLDIEANLRGQLSASGNISHPKLKGDLSISEGSIIFPSASFDLLETQIPLKETSTKIFDPEINISATQELDPEHFSPLITQPTTVQLALKGDLDRLNLELKPISGDTRLSQLTIFLLLISPRIAGLESKDQFDLLTQRAKSAALAVSGEIFLRPLTNEIQELIEGRTKTRVQFGSGLEPGGMTLRLNWKLGPRIEFQGSYMVLSDDAKRLISGKSSFFIDSNPLADLRLKLLLFDHRPLGPLSLETSFGSLKTIEGGIESRSKIRLNYRVLSK